jgi:hypothetical protein
VPACLPLKAGGTGHGPHGTTKQEACPGHDDADNELARLTDKGLLP